MCQGTVPNSAPVTHAASYSVIHDTILSDQVNSHDSHGHAITTELVTDAEHGPVTLNADLTFTCISLLHTNHADTISVSTPNACSTFSYILLLDTDHEKVIWLPTHNADGKFSYVLRLHTNHAANIRLPTLSTDRTFTYTPNTHFVGTDSFTFTFSDLEA
ncbi:MAG: Ig-like domain-containing protein [Candidatus Methanomethylicaceae archaeon]